MTAKTSLKYLAVLLALGLVAAACGSDDTDAGNSPAATTAAPASATTMDPNMDMGHDDDADDHDGAADDEHAAEYDFGTPMEAAHASRVIEITANDNFTFEPASVTVAAGEVVTFRVTNAGVIPHDFTLGDSHMQDEHESEMAEMAEMAGMAGMEGHDEPNVFALESGETNEMTWQMNAGGEVLFGCHQPGHYDAGMVGDITIGA